MAIHRAEATSDLDAVVALSIAIEVELEDLDRRIADNVASSVLRLEEEEALELMRLLPAEARLAAESGQTCALLNDCQFRPLLLDYYSRPSSAELTRVFRSR